VSAKQKISLPRQCGRTPLFLLLGVFLVIAFLPRNARADSLEEGARALARKVWSSIHSTSVQCEFRNYSTLRAGAFASLATAFEEELQRRGIKIVQSEAAVELVVTVTQDPTEYIGVVQIQRRGNSETIMETIGPVSGPPAPAPAFNLTLRREFLFSQNDPIVDVVFDSDSKRAFVLGFGELSTYVLRDGNWVSAGSERLPRHGVMKRNDRGYLGVGIDSESAVFPEESCTLSMLPGTNGWDCRKNTSEIGVRSVSAEAMSGKKLGPWISAAQLDTDGKTRIVVTGEDGLARLYEDGPEPVAVLPNWGSEIASVYSGCGSGWQLLVTGTGDWTKPDEIQAIDIKDRRAQTVSDPMEFPGPVTVLRTPGRRAGENAAAQGQALAVDRNLQTGRYEAYLLSIACTK
jgi:hypothetical protein